MRQLQSFVVVVFAVAGLALAGLAVVAATTASADRRDAVAFSHGSATGAGSHGVAVALSDDDPEDEDCDNSGSGNCEDRPDDQDDGDGDDDDEDDDLECDNSGPGNCEDRGDAGAGQVTGVTAPDGSIVVQIVDRSFQPSSIAIQTGVSVTFVNNDDEHTATGLGFDTGVIPPGGSATVTLTESGSFDFVCAFHPEMTGTIAVAAGGATPAAVATPAADATPLATPAASPVAGDEVTVSIVDFAFEAATLTVPPGTTVVWTNDGQAPHTVTGDWADSGTLVSGDVFRFTFDEPGTFGYACNFHPDMIGEVIVDPSTPPPGD